MWLGTHERFGSLMGTVLAFDFGEKRIGVATGETLLGSAHPLTVIHAESNDDRFAAIGKLIAEWRPEQLVVGLPTHADGTPHEMTRLATKFAERLKKRFDLPVSFADERLTSLDAEARLRETGRNSKSAKPLLDAVAAQLILQTWFESPHHVTPAQPTA
jgi:putative Holliday junction resolvase